MLFIGNGSRDFEGPIFIFFKQTIYCKLRMLIRVIIGNLPENPTTLVQAPLRGVLYINRICLMVGFQYPETSTHPYFC